MLQTIPCPAMQTVIHVEKFSRHAARCSLIVIIFELSVSVLSSPIPRLELSTGHNVFAGFDPSSRRFFVNRQSFSRAWNSFTHFSRRGGGRWGKSHSVGIETAEVTEKEIQENCRPYNPPPGEPTFRRSFRWCVRHCYPFCRFGLIVHSLQKLRPVFRRGKFFPETHTPRKQSGSEYEAVVFFPAGREI